MLYLRLRYWGQASSQTAELAPRASSSGRLTIVAPRVGPPVRSRQASSGAPVRAQVPSPAALNAAAAFCAGPSQPPRRHESGAREKGGKQFQSGGGGSRAPGDMEVSRMHGLEPLTQRASSACSTQQHSRSNINTGGVRVCCDCMLFWLAVRIHPLPVQPVLASDTRNPCANGHVA